MTATRRRTRRANPALWVVGNPPPALHSETQQLHRLAAEINNLFTTAMNGEHREAEYHRAKAAEIVTRMLQQVERGVHVNPGARHGTKLSNDVQAVVYEHVTEGPRCHGYGNADIDLRTRGDTLSITGLHERTGVEMFGLPDGSVLLRHKQGKPVWGRLPA